MTSLADEGAWLINHAPSCAETPSSSGDAWVYFDLWQSMDAKVSFALRSPSNVVTPVTQHSRCEARK